MIALRLAAAAAAAAPDLELRAWLEPAPEER
jgi:hypothetical protein